MAMHGGVLWAECKQWLRARRLLWEAGRAVRRAGGAVGILVLVLAWGRGTLMIVPDDNLAGIELLYIRLRVSLYRFGAGQRFHNLRDCVSDPYFLLPCMVGFKHHDRSG